MAASTGSPASRRLTKRTPLTTRPSLTSRQGMTRTLNMSGRLRRLDQGERLLGVETPVVERAAGDGAGKCVHRLAGKRAVEIDQVQPFETNRLEGPRLGGGIAVEHGRAPHVALFEADHLA